MSWWPSTSGRYSPFTSFYSRSGPPAVTEDDYSYLAGDDDHLASDRGRTSYGYPSSNNTTSSYRHHGGSHNQHYTTRTSSPQATETTDLDPDILILRHKGTTYPLHFPAFSIAEGDLKVRDVRRLAAQELRVEDPRRVKLLYKGKQMRDDRESCKRENLKQNSEVLCVVSSERLPSRTGEDGYSSNSSNSSNSAEVSSTTNGIDGSTTRIDVDGTIIDGGSSSGGRRKKRKGHRGGSNKKRKDRDALESATSTAVPGGGGKDFLAPPSSATATNGSSPSGAGSTHSRSASPVPPAHCPPSTATTTTTTNKKPSTPAEALTQIQETFNNTLLPAVQSFITNPPPRGSKEREMEYKRLSESVLQQVILKLDGVETMGDEGLRGRRKEMVKMVQGVLAELDKVEKR